MRCVGTIRYMPRGWLLDGRSSVAREKDGLQCGGDATRKAIDDSRLLAECGACGATMKASLEHDAIDAVCWRKKETI